MLSEEPGIQPDCLENDCMQPGRLEDDCMKNDSIKKGCTKSDKESCNSKAIFRVSKEAHFYGLGQHQNAGIGYKGEKIEIKHDNTTIAMPFLLTNDG